MSAEDVTSIIHAGPDGNIRYLPLQKVDVSVMIVDVSAQFVLRHTFVNEEDKATGQAKYVVPLPASAVACAFQMEMSDGRLIVGVAKETAQAQAEYDVAVATGKASGIVNWANDDIFSISVGCIPPKTEVTTALTCVMSLVDNASPEEVRFQLPMAVGAMRYGTPPAEIQDALNVPSRTRLRISASIQTSGELEDVSSPSHADAFVLQAYETHHGRPSRRRWTASIESPTFLDRDFVLVIRAKGYDAPRAFAERDEERGTVAIQLTVMPKFDIPRVAQQEYLFLVDRSGSMGGTRIEQARKALTLLLKILPSGGTTVNIFSFGDGCDSLWPQSMAYEYMPEEELNSYIRTMDANYGGTEMRRALSHVFANRNKTKPTAVFLLTDGEAYDIDGTKLEVAQAVQGSPSDGPLRVFVLGIGNTTSSAMCGGIARAGNGFSLMAVDHEEIIKQCLALVMAGTQPLIIEGSMDWGMDATAKPQTAAPYTTAAGVQLQSPPIVQQIPSTIGTLYKTRRFVVYAILKTKVIPKEIVLKGAIQNGLGSFTAGVVVKLIKKYSLTGAEGTPIHCLAARHLITELQEGKAPLPAAIGNPSVEDIKKAAIVRLGVDYHLVSQYTSFVAVDEGETVWTARRRRRQAASVARQSKDQEPALTTWNDLATMGFAAVTNAFKWVLGHSAPSGSGGMPGGMPSRSPSRSPPVGRQGNDDDDKQAEGDEDDTEDDQDADRASVVSYSTMSSLESDEDWEEDEPVRRARPQKKAEPVMPARRRSPSPFVNHTPAPRQHTVEQKPPIAQEVVKLIEMQSIDGSFSEIEALKVIVGEQAVAEGSKLRVADETWATVLAVAYYKKKLADQPDLLHGLVEKMMEYLGRKETQATLAGLLARADELIN